MRFRIYKVQRIQKWMFLYGLACIAEGLVLVLTLGHFCTSLPSLAMKQARVASERQPHTRDF